MEMSKDVLEAKAESERKKMESEPDRSANDLNHQEGFVFVRDDDYGSEKKGSVQDHAYTGDSTTFSPSRTKNGVDTFHVRQKKR